ncbi:hypothetical protein FRB94_000164 [Tulasnella sp. JGI-2019a]|nr:hypothetical protein FRB94_000164 [Tulasnella sp. JGI-2019a]KAG9015847.1 hypothetical protein FRB93_012412 [Tulasnella sp. JGI-2019a]KAG9039520.1 hypothetical protein FRB95_009100 [Tulasnella sp. JGI-2019a]
MSAIAPKQKAAATAPKQLSAQEIQAVYSRLQHELQTLAQKIGELESEAEEHELVLKTLEEIVDTEPDRVCFRLIGGILVERTVKEVTPKIRTNRDGIRSVLDNLVAQYKGKEDEFQSFQKEYRIRVAGRS